MRHCMSFHSGTAKLNFMIRLMLMCKAIWFIVLLDFYWEILNHTFLFILDILQKFLMCSFLLIIWRDLTKVIFILYYRSQDWHVPAGNITRVSMVGGEHSRKEPFEQLVNPFSEHQHMNDHATSGECSRL